MRFHFIPLLYLLLLICESFEAQLLYSSSSEVLTDTLTIEGRKSNLIVDIFGLNPDYHDSPAIQIIEAACKHISNVWISRVSVRTRISFMDLGSPDALASGGGVLFVRFDNSPDRELLPIAAAESITGNDLNSKSADLDFYDILIKVNTKTQWNVDLKSRPTEKQFDLYTVILHEAYHNLIFSGAVTVKGESPNRQASLIDGYPARFDLFLANEEGCAILDYLKDQDLANSLQKSPANLLAAAVTNERLFFFDEFSGLRVPLYSPEEYKSKSSIYHIDFERGGKEGVMNRFIPAGFMERRINNQMRKMQKALLDPKRRGAKHCKFPLSNPIRSLSQNNTDISVDSSTTIRSTHFRFPVWAIAIACFATLLLTLISYFFCSHLIMKKKQKAAMRPANSSAFISADSDIFNDKQFTHASTDFLIDETASVGQVDLDVRDVEIKEEEYNVFQYDTQKRKRYVHERIQK